MKFRKINSKSVLSKKNVLNIYRGCTNNCICCFNRSRCAGVKDFNEIGVRLNAVELLEPALRHKRKKAMITVSNLADPYQDIEKELKIFRSVLELLEQKEFGINIRTKNNLIYRDIELLDRINYKTKATVEVTLNTTDDELRQIIEPNAATVSERIQLIKDLNKINIPVLLRIKPILPFINDSKENLEALLDLGISNNVKGIILDRFGVKINNTSRDYFFEQLSKYLPEIHDQYIENFGTSFNYESPNALELSELFNRKVSENILTDRREIFFFEKKYLNRNQGEQLRFF